MEDEAPSSPSLSPPQPPPPAEEEEEQKASSTPLWVEEGGHGQQQEKNEDQGTTSHRIPPLGWIEVHDPDTGQLYYYHEITKTVSWEFPPPEQHDDTVLLVLPPPQDKPSEEPPSEPTTTSTKMEPIFDPVAQEAALASLSKAVGAEWMVVFDQDTGLPLFINQDTNETTWDIPHHLEATVHMAILNAEQSIQPPDSLSPETTEGIDPFFPTPPSVGQSQPESMESPHPLQPSPHDDSEIASPHDHHSGTFTPPRPETPALYPTNQIMEVENNALSPLPAPHSNPTSYEVAQRPPPQHDNMEMNDLEATAPPPPMVAQPWPSPPLMAMAATDESHEDPLPTPDNAREPDAPHKDGEQEVVSGATLPCEINGEVVRQDEATPTSSPSLPPPPDEVGVEVVTVPSNIGPATGSGETNDSNALPQPDKQPSAEVSIDTNITGTAEVTSDTQQDNAPPNNTSLDGPSQVTNLSPPLVHPETSPLGHDQPQEGGGHNQATVTVEGTSGPSLLPDVSEVWEEHMDPSTGHVYLVNAHTGMSKWAHDPAVPPNVVNDPIPIVGTSPSGPLEDSGAESMNQSDTWSEAFDDTTGQVYYVNDSTGESQWQKPDQYQLVVATSQAIVDASPWEEAYDYQTGQIYYFNQDTGESRWHNPDEAPSNGDNMNSRNGQTSEELYDPITGQRYYYNSETHESKGPLEDSSNDTAPETPNDHYPTTQLASPPYYTANPDPLTAEAAAGQPFSAATPDPSSPAYYDYSQYYGDSIAYYKNSNMTDYYPETSIQPYNSDTAPQYNFSSLESLHAAAGQEIQELQKTVAQQSDLVYYLGKSVEELKPVSDQVVAHTYTHQTIIAKQEQVMAELDDAINNLQEVARGFLAKPSSSSSEVKEAVAEALLQHQHQLVLAHQSTGQGKEKEEDEFDDDDFFLKPRRGPEKGAELSHKEDTLRGLLDFASIEVDEELTEDQAKARALIIAKADAAEQEEEEDEATQIKKRSYALMHTVPQKLLKTWQYRRSRKEREQQHEVAIRDKTSFNTRHLRKIKGKFKEMLTELKEQDRYIDKRFDDGEESTDESDYEVVDLEDIAPRSIILGQRGKWLELLEPKRAFVFYQDIDTGKYQKEVPDFKQLPARPEYRRRLVREQTQEKIIKQERLYTANDWRNRIQHQKESLKKRSDTTSRSLFRIPTLKLLSDAKLRNLKRQQEEAQHTMTLAPGGRLDSPASRRVSTTALMEENGVASISQPTALSPSQPHPVSARAISPKRARRRRATDGEGREGSDVDDEDQGESEQQESKDQDHSRAFLIGGNHKVAYTVFGNPISIKQRLKRERAKRDENRVRLQDLKDKAASKRIQHHDEQSQAIFLDEVVEEMARLLGRQLDRRRMMQGRHVLGLLRHQASCVSMSQDSDRTEGSADYHFDGTKLVKDDGLWVDLETRQGSHVYVRDHQGVPAFQRGKPLRYRLLSCVNSASLHHRFGGGWEEHRWEETPFVESKVYCNKYNKKVTWKKPQGLTAPHLIATKRRGSIRVGFKPRPPPPILQLGSRQSSGLTAGIISILRKPDRQHSQNLVAVAGFTLLLVQSGQYDQAVSPIDRLLALALADDIDLVPPKVAPAGKESQPAGAPDAAQEPGILSSTQRSNIIIAAARLLILAKDFGRAEKLARLALFLTPDEAHVMTAVGEIMMYLNRDEDAERVLLAALLLDQQHTPACRMYARLSAKKGRQEAANTYYQRSIVAKANVLPWEGAQACLEYAQYLLEPWENKVPIAERYLRQAYHRITAQSNETRSTGTSGGPIIGLGDEHLHLKSEVDKEVLADIYLTLGRLYHLYRRDSHSAVEYYLQAIKIQPESYPGLLHYACLLSTSKLPEDHQQADAVFRKAFTLRQRGNFLDRLLYSHFLASQMEDYAQSEEECLHAMATLPGVAAPALAMASLIINAHDDSVTAPLPPKQEAQQRQCDSKRKKELFSHLSKVYPNDAAALTALAFLHLDNHDLATECFDLLDEALEVSGGKYAPALRGKGILKATVDNDPEGALTYFLRGLDCMPTNVPLLRTAAMFISTREAQPTVDMQRQALSYLDRALSLEPNHVETLIATALLKLKYAQDQKAAIVLLKKAATVCNVWHALTKSRCYRLLGHIYYDRGANKRASDAFACALRLVPTEPVALVAYAATVASMSPHGQHEEAEKYFAQAFEAESNSTSSDDSQLALTTIPTYCHMMYGVYKFKVRYDKRAARELFIKAATDKSRPPNCLALYYLGVLAGADMKLHEMEKWMVWALETEPNTPIQMVEFTFMLQEIKKDFRKEKQSYEQAHRRVQGRSKSIYKEKWVEKYELFKQVLHYAKLREKYLGTKRGLDLRSLPWTSIFMAEVGWEKRYMDQAHQADSWASLFCGDIASREAAGRSARTRAKS